MRDSHSRDRTFTFTISDGGDPPSGVNTSTDAGVGPTMYTESLMQTEQSTLGQALYYHHLVHALRVSWHLVTGPHL